MGTPVREVTSLQCLKLDLPPSCVEFCPAHTDYFVVGTYNLQNEEPTAVNEDGAEVVKKPQSRNGSLVVFRLGERTDIFDVQTVSYPSALLDLHFNPHEDKHEVLATVSSTGTLSFFQLAPQQQPSAPLNELGTYRPLGDDESVLFLSCAWHPGLSYLLAITTSDYQVHILRVDESWSVHRTSSSPVITHTLEAWTVAFSPFLAGSIGVMNDTLPEPSYNITIYSGGDDSKLFSTTCIYNGGKDNDTADSDDDTLVVPYPTITTKGHMAGVTAILPLPLTLLDESRVVVSGSYDDHVRVYSIHSQFGDALYRPPKLLIEANLGGGVWRLKLIKIETPAEDDTTISVDWSVLILASCMHAGSRVIKICGNYDGSCRVHVLGRFEEHKSMNYGSDFQPSTSSDNRPLRCVSTSFYDRLLCLWEF